MKPQNSEPVLSPQAVATFEIALQSFSTSHPSKPIDIGGLVRYVAGTLEPEDAAYIETSIVEDLRLGDLLASTYRTVESLRQLTWLQLNEYRPADDLTRQVRSEWIECASSSLADDPPPSFSIANILSIASASRRGAKLAAGIISQIQEIGLAPRRPAFAAATRLGLSLPILEGHLLRESGMRFEADILSEGSLSLTMAFQAGSGFSGRTLWIAFEANRQWLCLGSAEVTKETATILLPGFGPLMDLQPGPLPAGIFSIRFDEWPTVCEKGALVVQTGSEPFAEIESLPQIQDGNVTLDIRLLPQSADLLVSNELEMWFGTGGHVWQLLGRWPLPELIGETMSLTCPSPKPGPIGVAFPGVLRLALRP